MTFVIITSSSVRRTGEKKNEYKLSINAITPEFRAKPL